MENRPVISMAFPSIAPGVDDETAKRYNRWVMEVYHPMSLKLDGVMGIDNWRIVGKNPEYPLLGAIYHYGNITAYENSLKSPERQAIIEDLKTWGNRGVTETVWNTAYGLVQSFRDETGSSIGKKQTTVEIAPVMHLEAYRIRSEDQEKYNKWFQEYSRVFVPLFVKNCGLKGFDYFKCLNLPPRIPPREIECPAYISILYFENLKAFEDFEESSEQVSFQRALRNLFPLGLSYWWYVQYQLNQSLRK